VQRRPDYDKGIFLDIPLQHLGSIIGNPLPHLSGTSLLSRLRLISPAHRS